MALFSRKTETSVETTPNVAVPTKALPTDRNLALVLKAPRVTEKSVKLGDQHVYTFVVNEAATKTLVRDAVKATFGVTPVKVNIVNKKARRTASRKLGRTVSVQGMKKAYVYLKKGDTINLI
jgi:large subunit ribosomal protein L23